MGAMPAPGGDHSAAAVTTTGKKGRQLRRNLRRGDAGGYVNVSAKVPHGTDLKQQGHRERVASAGKVTGPYWAMVHTPISVQEALRIPAGRTKHDR